MCLRIKFRVRAPGLAKSDPSHRSLPFPHNFAQIRVRRVAFVAEFRFFIICVGSATQAKNLNQTLKIRIFGPPGIQRRLTSEFMYHARVIEDQVT